MSSVPCVLYARVSTREQAEEGYSISAQLKALHGFCETAELAPVREFVEASSAAGAAGRAEFEAMLAFLAGRKDVECVVAHKVDRLSRNFGDMLRLDDLGVRTRFVIGDMPDTPVGDLIRDMQLSQAKFYSANLSEEVTKGMREKVAQGGWPHRAPFGYGNDRATRTLVVEPTEAAWVRRAFERYAGGGLSVAMLASELNEQGMRTRGGKRFANSTLANMLRNPLYTGRIPYDGTTYPGLHEPLVPDALFEQVQERLDGNRNGSKQRTKHTFPLRGFMTCDVCGCTITAEHQKGHDYYHCTHGKGRDVCDQRRYIREEDLAAQVDEVLGRIAISPAVVAALTEEARDLDREEVSARRRDTGAVERDLERNRTRTSRLVDAYLDGNVTEEAYRLKEADLADERRTLERRLESLSNQPSETYQQVERLAMVGAGAQVAFRTGSATERKEVLGNVLSNLTLRDGSIATYQYKDPFGLLEMESEGAFKHPWWAILDLNQ